MNLPVLETRETVKTYMVKAGLFKGKRPLRAVNGVNMALAQGEVLGLVGESGCGKSTLARLLLGLEEVTGGEVRLGGRPLSESHRREVARRIQPVFQDPYASLNPRKSVGAIVALPLRVHGVGDPGSWRRKAEEMLDVVGLPRRLIHNYPNQLSGGQRQRVAIARALIMRPEVVICDEPTSALDVSVQAQILNLLMDLREEFGLTYILISHDLAVVQHMASRVAVMYLGRIVEELPTEELFERPRHPYTQALLASALTPEPRKGLPDTHLGVAYPNPIDPPPGCTFHPRCPRAGERCFGVAPQPIFDRGRLVECHFPENT
jgi:peptide/nickel transport system ATP-binding protein